MKKLLVISHGTYCDQVLLQSVLTKLRERFKIVALTSSTDNSFDKRDIVFRHDAPQWTTQDASLDFADSLKHLAWTSLQNPVQAISLLRWHREVRALYSKEISQYTFARVLVWYPAFTLYLSIYEFLSELPVSVLYCAPAYCNTSIPWIYDGYYRDKKYNPYTSRDRNIVEASWVTHIARWSKLTSSNITDILQKIHIITMWDKFQMPRDIAPLFENKIDNIGAWQATLTSSWKEAPEHISEFIHRKSKLIFMSFGTYAADSYVLSVMKTLKPVLEHYCTHNDAGVLFHNGNSTYDCDWLQTFRGFIPYGYIAPLCDLVIFTGSLCLQNVCLLAKTRMLFVPFLAEQHFWAKNYKFFTGVDYVVASSTDTQKILTNAISSQKAQRWIRKVCNHMVSIPPPEVEISKLIVY